MEEKLIEIHNSLGITPQHLLSNRLSLQTQPQLKELEVVEIDFEGKPFILIEPAALAWRQMKSAAQLDGVVLLPFSGFRSYWYQKILIERQLKGGRTLGEIFTHIAIPGYSEHHSGRAVDIHSTQGAVLEEEFENTDAFSWLCENAPEFGFRLSYPRGNSCGIIYEPWHWYYLLD